MTQSSLKNGGLKEKRRPGKCGSSKSRSGSSSAVPAAVTPETVAMRGAWQAVGVILHRLGENFGHLARGPEWSAENGVVGESELLLLLRFHELIRKVSELIGGLEGCDEDAADEINREFRTLKEFLEAQGMLGARPPGEPGCDEGW
jgi:hypothetical protein